MTSPNTPTRPNILFIQSDQHNPSVTGCYGDPVVETPSLDRLAARGARLTSAYCASPICVPSRMSLITGRFPHENEVWTNDQTLDSAIPTYAHALGAAGYRPVQIGRMHFNGPDQLHGFAERTVGDHSPNWPGSPRPVDHGRLSGTAGPDRVSLELSGSGQSAYEVHDEDVVAATEDYLDNFGESNAPGAPLCLSVGLMLPHQPFVARPQDYARVRGTRRPSGNTRHTPRRLPPVHPVVARADRNRTGQRSRNHPRTYRILGARRPARRPDRPDTRRRRTQRSVRQPHHRLHVRPRRPDRRTRASGGSRRSTRARFASPRSSRGRPAFPRARSSTTRSTSSISWQLSLTRPARRNFPGPAPRACSDCSIRPKPPAGTTPRSPSTA